MTRADRTVHVGEVVAVRITSLLGCPNWRCGRVLYSPTPRIGEAWMTCSRGDGWSQRSMACGQHWFNITLPPSSTGDDLARIIGRDEAIALLWRIQSGRVDETPEPELAEIVLSHRLLLDDGGHAVHIQIPCRRRDEHLFRYAPIRSLLRALKLAS